MRLDLLGEGAVEERLGARERVRVLPELLQWGMGLRAPLLSDEGRVQGVCGKPRPRSGLDRLVCDDLARPRQVSRSARACRRAPAVAAEGYGA